MNIYWTTESWGADHPPKNAEIEKANALIDAFAETHDEDETEIFSERLWDHYCITGNVEDPSEVDYLHYPVGDPF